EPLRDCIQTDAHVMAVSKRGFLKEESPGDARRGAAPFRLLIRDSKKVERSEEADIVLDCTGTYGQHRWRGDGGTPAVGALNAAAGIPYWLEDLLGERKNQYAGKSIVVVGSGYSAAATVCSLASLGEQNSDTWVVWLARGAGSQPIRRIPGDPLKERDRLAV